MSIDDLNRELEQRLRSSLNRQADDQSGHGADLADVFGRARRIRRRRTALVASAAAVAVAAVAVPAGVLVASRDTSAPPPPVSTVSSTPTPTPTQTASGAGLGGIAMGAQTSLTYIDPAGKLHNGQALPGGEYDAGGFPVNAFTPYHGGWLITYDDGVLRQYDSSGKLVVNGTNATNMATIVASDDGTQTAWQIGQDVYAGIPSGMGNGQQQWQVDQSTGLLGFLGGGVAVSDGHGVRVLTGPTSSTTIHTSVTATVVSQSDDLIGGIVGTVKKGDQQGAMADGTTGAVLWHGSWRPVAFSPDGKYVAAVPVVDNGDPSAIAILDARTGAVVARTQDVSGRLYLGWTIAWDDTRVVFEATAADGSQRQALFSLDAGGRMAQVSAASGAAKNDNGPIGFVFMTR